MHACGHNAKRDEKSIFCHSCYMARYRQKNQEKTRVIAKRCYEKGKATDPSFYVKRRKYQLRTKYGLDNHGPECEICGATKKLCIDHSHITGTIRGTLCKRCNTAIALLGDELEGLRKAINYLEKVK